MNGRARGDGGEVKANSSAADGVIAGAASDDGCASCVAEVPVVILIEGVVKIGIEGDGDGLCEREGRREE